MKAFSPATLPNFVAINKMVIVSVERNEGALRKSRQREKKKPEQVEGCTHKQWLTLQTDRIY